MKGTDEAVVAPQLQTLLSASGGRWNLASEGEALERSFKFKTFTKTWDFMTAVSLQCKIKNHHPEWSNIPPPRNPPLGPVRWKLTNATKVYNTTFIRWTTHSPQGLSDKDVSMATICDSLAKDFGELDPEPVACSLRDVADSAKASAGGDCCTPKK
ncbi:Pterin-4-alpha-carbinolamine dehydratase [Paramyrothecium foliicola]|nr:Pterin-4-alpha-carbinolamine dehydratase [Paramyrothecium foliicola]